MAKKKPAFEEALQQLESIARQIESGQIGLEDSISRYEEGMGLIRHCRDVLARAEMRIQKIQLDDDGRVQSEALSDPTGSAGPSGGGDSASAAGGAEQSSAPGGADLSGHGAAG